MHLNIFLLLSSLNALMFCSQPNNAREAGNALSAARPAVALGDTVQAPGNNIMSVYQDKQNNYWFGSWQDGLYRYDGKTILHFTTKHGLPHNRVEDIQEDKSGNIFFNTSGGVCQFNGQKISVLQAQESDVWQLQPDDLWFKSLQYDGKIYRYDGENLYSLQVPECPPGEAWTAKYPTNPTPYGIYTIYKDSRKNIWFGTAALGACRYNGQTFDWISEEDVTELHNGPSNGVRSIIEDKDGYFWFNSAYRYEVYWKNHTPQKTFYNREKSIGNLDGKPDSDFWEYLSIARDNHNNLWFATYTRGVWQYDGNKTIHYPVQAWGTNIHVFCIYKDNKGDLWLGTHEHGVYKFNGRSFERFSP